MVVKLGSFLTPKTLMKFQTDKLGMKKFMFLTIFGYIWGMTQWNANSKSV